MQAIPAAAELRLQFNNHQVHNNLILRKYSTSNKIIKLSQKVCQLEFIEGYQFDCQYFD